MNIKELFDDFNEIEQKKERLQREIKFLDKMKETRLEILRNSVIFDVSIVKAIANLLSIKEKDKYNVFMYGMATDLFVDGNSSVDNNYVGITSNRNIKALEHGKSLKELLDTGEIYTIFLYNIDLSEDDTRSIKYIGLYDCLNDRKFISFKYLLDEYIQFSSYFPFRSCHCNFDNHEYVKDYIRFLCDRQIQNNGKRLTYDEMNSAIYEFLNMNKEEVKRIIRKK